MTLLYLLADPGRNELTVSNAGHPPPVLMHADGTVLQLALADGPPLGIAPQERLQSTLSFSAGDTIVAFTDGLIERRGEDITEGQERVANAVRALAGRDLPAALRALVETVSDPSRDDDVAVLATRRLS